MNRHDDEGKPVRMAFDVSSDRVQHYNGVIDSMVRSATEKFSVKHGRPPSSNEIASYQKELIRFITIQRELRFGSSLEIQPEILLLE